MAKGKETGQDGPQPVDKDKGKGKKVKSLPEAKGTKAALTVKGVVSKAKDAESKSKTAKPKEDPPRAKAWS